MWNEELKVYVGILSHDRVGNIPKMQSFVGKATWYVGIGESKKYLDNGAFSCKEVDGNLVSTRNVLLRDAYEKNYDCLMLDDDMKNLNKIEIINGKPKKLPIDMKDVVDICRKFLKESGLKLAGITHFTNIMWYNPKIPVRFDDEIANFFYSKPCDVFFDEEMEYMHDLDYALQHITKKGGGVSLQNIIAEFHVQLMKTDGKNYMEQKGGMYKNTKNRIKAYNMMKKKWGNLVKDRKFVKQGTRNDYLVTLNRKRGRK